jgi:hypothetical protein
MSYEPLSKFCSVNGSLHSQDITYCSICRSGTETIDLSETPPSRTSSALSKPQLLPPAALIQRDVVNNRLKNIQNSRSNAGSYALSSRMPNQPRTTSQQFAFTIVLISESFYYASKEDHEFGLPTIITRKHIGMLICQYRTIYTYLYSSQHCYSDT